MVLPLVLGTLWGPLGTRLVTAAQGTQLRRIGHPLRIWPKIGAGQLLCRDLAPGCRTSLGSWGMDNQIRHSQDSSMCLAQRREHGSRACLSQSHGHCSSDPQMSPAWVPCCVCSQATAEHVQPWGSAHLLTLLLYLGCRRVPHKTH